MSMTASLYLSCTLFWVLGEKSLNDVDSIVSRKRLSEMDTVICSSFATYAAVRAAIPVSLDEVVGRDRKASATVLLIDPIIFSVCVAFAALLSDWLNLLELVLPLFFRAYGVLELPSAATPSAREFDRNWTSSFFHFSLIGKSGAACMFFGRICSSQRQ